MADKIIRKQPAKFNNVQTNLIPKTKLCFEGSWLERKIVLYKNWIKDCLPLPDVAAQWLTCDGLVGCPIIVSIQWDLNQAQNDIQDINILITALQNATTVEAIQDIIAPMLVHNNHSGLTAAYDDANNQIILTVSWWGGWFTCADVATCIGSSSDTQLALLNWLQTLPNVTLVGNWNFTWDVSYSWNITYINPATATGELNQIDMTINNINVHTINDWTSNIDNNWNTVNNNNNIINNLWTTEINWGTYNSPVIDNPTFTWTITWIVKTVSGNIVNNIDPVNPVVTQVQPDWSLSSWLGSIANKSVKPTEIAWTTTNGKLVVRNTNTTFRDATASDITALWFNTSPWSWTPISIPTTWLWWAGWVNFFSPPIQFIPMWLVKYDVISLTWQNARLTLQRSSDWITYTDINQETNSFSIWNIVYCRRIMVEPNSRIRFKYIADVWSGATITASFIWLY